MHFSAEINSQDKHFLFQFICQFCRFLSDLLHRFIVLCCIFPSVLYSYYSLLFCFSFCQQNLQTITWKYGIWEAVAVAVEDNHTMEEMKYKHKNFQTWTLHYYWNLLWFFFFEREFVFSMKIGTHRRFKYLIINFHLKRVRSRRTVHNVEAQRNFNFFFIIEHCHKSFTLFEAFKINDFLFFPRLCCWHCLLMPLSILHWSESNIQWAIISCSVFYVVKASRKVFKCMCMESCDNDWWLQQLLCKISWEGGDGCQ
jgi:hypothetical protein